VKAVTFEVTTQEAQKLTLAATVGQLSLALRNKASAGVEDAKRVRIADLDQAVAANLAEREEEQPKPQPVVKAPSTDIVVGVSRNMQRSEYRVRRAAF
jgi:pilus assembly protein CpaB